jgi:hypothetical protein
VKLLLKNFPTKIAPRTVPSAISLPAYISRPIIWTISKSSAYITDVSGRTKEIATIKKVTFFMVLSSFTWIEIDMQWQASAEEMNSCVVVPLEQLAVEF